MPNKRPPPNPRAASVFAGENNPLRRFLRLEASTGGAATPLSPFCYYNSFKYSRMMFASIA
jgi:hypothetical protein